MRKPTMLMLAAGFVLSAHAQVRLEHAFREVYASGGDVGWPPYTESFSTSGSGAWSAEAHAPSAFCEQQSTLTTTRIQYHCVVGAGGGAGHYGSSTSSLTAALLVESYVRWGIINSWDGNLSAHHQFIRLSDGADLLSGFDWSVQYGTTGGVLTPGRYELRLLNGAWSEGTSGAQDITFSIRVPSPPALALAAAPLAARRRRR